MGVGKETSMPLTLSLAPILTSFILCFVFLLSLESTSLSRPLSGLFSYLSVCRCVCLFVCLFASLFSSLICLFVCLSAVCLFVVFSSSVLSWFIRRFSFCFCLFLKCRYVIFKVEVPKKLTDRQKEVTSTCLVLSCFALPGRVFLRYYVLVSRLVVSFLLTKQKFGLCFKSCLRNFRRKKKYPPPPPPTHTHTNVLFLLSRLNQGQ